MPGCDISPPLDIDFSKIPYIGINKVYPAWEKAVKISLGIVVEILAVIGNLLVITIVIKFNAMRTTTNYYLLNLAVSDLLLTVFPIWVHVVDNLGNGWVFGPVLCKFTPLMQITAMCVSMFTLSTIALDRFYAVMFPLKSRVTKRNVRYAIAAIWITAIGVASPVVFMYYYEERRWADFTEKICTDIWPMATGSGGECDHLPSKRTYWIVVCAVLNWTLMICTIVAYAAIVMRLGRDKRGPMLGGNSARSTLQQRSKRKVVLMLALIFVAFLVCTLPFQTMMIYFLVQEGSPSYRYPDWYYTMNFAFIMLMYSHAAVNPIIYGGLSQSFRESFKDLIKGRSRSSRAKSMNTRMNQGTRGVERNEPHRNQNTMITPISNETMSTKEVNATNDETGSKG